MTVTEKKISKGRMKGRMLESAASLRGCLCMGEFAVPSLGTAMYNLHLLRAEALWICADSTFSQLCLTQLWALCSTDALAFTAGPISLQMQGRTENPTSRQQDHNVGLQEGNGLLRSQTHGHMSPMRVSKTRIMLPQLSASFFLTSMNPSAAKSSCLVWQACSTPPKYPGAVLYLQ